MKKVNEKTIKKIKLYGLGNEENFSHYTLEKTKKAHKILSRLFSKVFEIDWSLIKDFYDEKDKSQETNIDISKYIDFHERFGGMSHDKKDSRIDVFYGKNRIFLIIHCPQIKRKEFNRRLKKKILISKQKAKSFTITLSKPHNKDEKN